jgi:hypothetical protein
MEQYRHEHREVYRQNIPFNNKNIYLQLLTFISFVVYNYFVFNFYATGKSIAWVIIPGIFMLLLLLINLRMSFNITNVTMLITTVICSISTFYSAHKIRSSKTNDKDVDRLEIKYLVSILIFTVTVGIIMSPLTGWIAGDEYSSVYSRKFVYMFAIVCYCLYIMINTVRNYNLFDLKNLMFHDNKSDTTSNKYGPVIIICLWIIYSLIVFQGLQFIGKQHSNMEHYIMIAVMTLMWVVLGFVNSQLTNIECSKWTSTDVKDDSQEIYINIIADTFILILFTVISKLL